MSRVSSKTLRRRKKAKQNTVIHNHYYIDANGDQIKKPRGTKSKSHQAVEDYVRTLDQAKKEEAAQSNSAKKGIYAKPLPRIDNPDLLVREIAEKMYITGSMHLRRRQQLRKSVSKESIAIGGVFMNHIITVWGDRMLRSLELDEVMNYLFSVERSGSWKNAYISALNEIYQEGQFMGCKLLKPHFPKIGREQNKADIFTEAELGLFFRQDNFPHDFFLFFLTSLSGGLRLGETRALKVRQLIFEKNAIIIDGFLKDDNVTRTTYNKRGSPEHPKLRVVPYPNLTMSLLKQHIERVCAKEDDYIFVHNKRPISKSLAERAFITALMNAGLTWDKETLIKKGYWRCGHVQIKRDLIPDGRKLIPHSLRYTYITRMSRSLDAHNLLKLTGHDSTAMVDYYNRTNLEMALAEIPNVDTAINTLLPRAITWVS